MQKLPDVGATIYNKGISFTPRGMKKQWDLHGDKLLEYFTVTRFPVGKTIVYGLPKRLKTILCQWSGLCFATGKDWFGENIGEGTVVYLDLEELYRLSEDEHYFTMYLPRMLGMARNFTSGEDLPIDNFHYFTPANPVARKEVFDVIDEAIEKLQPKLLIVDSLGILLQGTQYSDYAVTLTELDKHLKVERTLFVAHQRKSGDKETPSISEEIFGAIQQGYWAQAIWKVERIQESDPSRIKVSFDERFGRTDPLNLEFDDVALALSPIIDEPEIESKIVQYLNEFLSGGKKDARETMEFVILKTKCSESYYHNVVHRLRKQNVINVEIDPTDNRKRLINLK